jgi:hypothetical protein
LVGGDLRWRRHRADQLGAFVRGNTSVVARAVTADVTVAARSDMWMRYPGKTRAHSLTFASTSDTQLAASSAPSSESTRGRAGIGLVQFATRQMAETRACAVVAATIPQLTQGEGAQSGVGSSALSMTRTCPGPRCEFSLRPRSSSNCVINAGASGNPAGSGRGLSPRSAESCIIL